MHSRPTSSQSDHGHVKAIVNPVLRRLLRLTFKLGLIALIGFGIAVLVRKFTAPADTPVPAEPWPPSQTESSGAAAVS